MAEKKYQREEIFAENFDFFLLQLHGRADRYNLDIESEFNGTLINSDMSWDEAYLAYFGKSKSDMKREKEQQYDKEHNRRTDVLMKVLVDKARTVLSPEYVDEWLKDTRDWVITKPEYAERALLTLRIAEVLQQGGSTYDAMLYAARAECSPDVSRDQALRDAHKYTNQDMATFREARREAYRAVDAFSNEHHIGLHGLHRELFDKYEAYRTGAEYVEPVLDENIQADLRTVSDALIHPDRLEVWGYHMEQEFATGQEGVENIKATIDILAAYESGTPLQDIKDMIYLIENMSPCDGDELRYNLFQAQDGFGFGKIHLQDMVYLQDETLLIVPPEKSVPQAYLEFMSRVEEIFPDRYEEFEQAINDALVMGVSGANNLQVGLDYLELIQQGVPLEEIKQQFDADERIQGEMRINHIVSFIEDMSQIEGIRDYLMNEPAITQNGPEDNDGHDDYDGPVGLGQ